MNRRSKEIAQGAHASMAFLARRVARVLAAQSDGSTAAPKLEFWDEARAWLLDHFTKVVLQAPGLETLRRVEAEALARGPNRADAIDAVTRPDGIVPLALY